MTRDDLVALFQGFDGSRYSQAKVGSFFEVSNDYVHGPLCSDAFPPDEMTTEPQRREVVVVNKLGTTLPILTGGLGELFVHDPGGDAGVDYRMAWKITETSIPSDALWRYTRRVLDENGDCGRTIEDRTQSRNVRVCPVHRIWKDERGRTVALFFDPFAINSCREGDEDCSRCPRYIGGQVWTRIKLKLDLIEVGDA